MDINKEREAFEAATSTIDPSEVERLDGIREGWEAYAAWQRTQAAGITMQQVLIAYDYATDHPHKYLRGTTNWCAAFAHSLNEQLAAAPAQPASPAQPEAQRLRGWLPIDTAPRGSGEDGPSRVDHPEYVEPPKLLIWGDEGPVVGSYEWYYHEGYGSGAVAGIPAWRDNQGEPIFGASHWMPLPAAPTLATSTGQEVES